MSEHIFAGLGHLVCATPGWTNDLANDAVEEYARQLAGCRNEACFAAAIDDVIQTWDKLGRPTVPAIIDAYNARLAAQPAIEPTRVHCDGSGWLPAEGGGGYTACPRCNPANAHAQADPATRDKWRTGVGLDELDVGVRRVKGTLRTEGPPLSKCSRAPEVPAQRDRARAAMTRGYLAECEAQGRAPSPIPQIGVAE